MRIMCSNWLSEGQISSILTTRDFKRALFMPCDQLRLSHDLPQATQAIPATVIAILSTSDVYGLSICFLFFLFLAFAIIIIVIDRLFVCLFAFKGLYHG